MADPHIPGPALLVVAVFSKHLEAFDWTRERLQRDYGPIGAVSPIYPFHHTKYYDSTMGPGQHKQLLAFEQLVAPEQLTAIKLHTNQLERELADSGQYAEARPVNLDPGLLTLGKFELATTKDQCHRIYLRDGIFAEVTLRFQDGQYEPWPWTYADYREDVVRRALKEFRDYYKQRLAAAGG
ncbi:MAG TPA: DUF4416 family protein [Gemmataceae bacterium]|nr:DUF4416 family protein [Gemmataceae bacterium]